MQFKFIDCLAGEQKLPLVIMRAYLLFFCAAVFGLSPGNGFSQDANIVVKRDKKVSVEQVFTLIRQQTNYTFVYRDDAFKNTPSISLKKGKTKASVLLDKVLSPVHYAYSFVNNTIVVRKKINQKPAVQDTFIIKGVVKDQDGKPLFGATVYSTNDEKSAKPLKATATDFDGKFSLQVSLNLNLVVSSVGYQVYKQKITSKNINYNIVLKQEVNQIKDVVITGIVTRKKESFTGATQTFTGSELKAIGNVNILQSLKTLDPSFIILENNDFGSDPNKLPNINIRGKTGFSLNTLEDEFRGNPNQPLFILDGFEVSLRTVADLDINRVASVTILKDAASTALYGANAANGVVVIETIRPKAGKLQISYSYNVNVEMPDLSDYNLMNASEKLEYERLTGLWDDLTSSMTTELRFFKYKKYNAILSEVRRGVNSYWLGEPIREGLTTGHFLRASGGSEVIRYGVGLNFRDEQGVMKGSVRKRWGANIDLTYRKGKFNVYNNLYVSGIDADNSPYGDFSIYTKVNPYFRKTDADGKITKYLNVQNYFDPEHPFLENIEENPLYNAGLKSINNNENFRFRNNINAIFNYNNRFKLNASFQVVKQVSTAVIFEPAENTKFNRKSVIEKGSYRNTRSDRFSYDLNAMATYTALIEQRHQITANLRTQIQQTKNKSLSFFAQGFPAGSDGDPAFSFGYGKRGKPNSSERLYRKVSFLASVNYSFDRTYLFDASYRLEGSTAFGANKKYSPFWSLGAGLNINRLLNMNLDKISLLKIRGSIGITGNQNFGSTASTSVYSYDSDANIFGQFLKMESLGNSDLKWQNTLDLSLGIDASFFKNRLNFTLNVYRNKTDPLVIQMPLLPSTGVSQYPVNMGYMNTKGAEVILHFSPIYKLRDQITWTLGFTASANKSEYGGFTDSALRSLYRYNQPLREYKNGYSPDDLWAVPSLGIDPANGEEVFLTKDGLTSYQYNPRDKIRVGNSNPDVQGVLSSNLKLKGFTMGINIRYSFGRDLFNYALLNKVESIRRSEVGQNHDLRALTSRWKREGDVSKFRSINYFTDNMITKQMSSRFLQRENVITGESINIGYEFINRQWMKDIGISSLSFRAIMNDIFRISSIKAERGIKYPFKRSVSFNLNVNF